MLVKAVFISVLISSPSLAVYVAPDNESRFKFSTELFNLSVITGHGGDTSLFNLKRFDGI